MYVLDIMSRTLISVKPENTIQEASEVMEKNKVGAVLVMKGDVLSGILTEKDIIKAISKSTPYSTNVKKIMTEEIISIGPNATVREAARIMLNKNVRRIPIVSEGKCIGIVTMNDVVRALLR